MHGPAAAYQGFTQDSTSYSNEDAAAPGQAYGVDAEGLSSSGSCSAARCRSGLVGFLTQNSQVCFHVEEDIAVLSCNKWNCSSRACTESTDHGMLLVVHAVLAPLKASQLIYTVMSCKRFH